MALYVLMFAALILSIGASAAAKLIFQNRDLKKKGEGDCVTERTGNVLSVHESATASLGNRAQSMYRRVSCY